MLRALIVVKGRKVARPARFRLRKSIALVAACSSSTMMCWLLAPRAISRAVSEHLTFDVRYQTALEIALGASSQHIIVEDEQAATKAIDFLKRNRAGRATFLPLTTIKARSISGQNQDVIASSPGFLGMADELVTFDAKLEAIFKNLLATTAIFDTVEHARDAARKVRYQVRMVTLDGTELRTGGSYAGGANRQNNSIFIKPELEQLQKEIAQEEKLLRQEEENLK